MQINYNSERRIIVETDFKNSFIWNMPWIGSAHCPEGVSD